MPVTIPQSSNFLGFLDRYSRDFETTEDYENIHEFHFDPHVPIGDTDKLRYGELYQALSDINEQVTGNKINISKLPDVTESIHLIDGNVRREKKNYHKWRRMIRDVAEQSDEFKYDLPEKNKKQFIDKHAKEMYGIYRTAMNMLPAKGTEQRDQVGKAFLYVINKEVWEKNYAPLVQEEADAYGKGWEGQTGGLDVLKRSWQSTLERGGLFMQATSDLTPPGDTMDAYEETSYYSGMPVPKSKVDKFKKGREIEMQAKDVQAILQQPTGKYLESFGDLSFDFEGSLDPYYILTKVGENLVTNVGSTGLSILGGVTATAALGPGAGLAPKIGAYVLGQGPGLGVNYAMESGEMYGSARDHLKEVRIKAQEDKGKMPKAEFDEKYSTYVSENIIKTADSLTDNEIHDISSSIAEFYGITSTMIEGATNLGALAGWAKQFGKVTTSALTGSKREMAKKLTEKFSPTIKKYAGVPITKIWALSREPLQEWLQEGTGEFLRAKALPQYLYDPNVKLDGAFGGFWFGAGTQVVGKAMQYKFGDKDSRDFTPEEGYSNVVRNAMEEAIVPWHAEGTVGDKERDIILKAGIIMNPTEGLGFINDLTSDPVERRELKKEAYGLIKKGYAKEGWANPEKATAMLVSNIDLVDRVYPNANVSDLRESGIQFTEEQLSKITGKAYSKPVGDYYNPADAGEDLNAPYPTDQYSGVHQEYNDPNEDMLAMELNQTQQELHILKTQRPDTAENRKKIETYEGVIRSLTKRHAGVHEDNTPKANEDPKSHIKQDLIDRLNALPEQYHDKKVEAPLIKAMKRKNASDKHIDAVRSVVEAKEKAYIQDKAIAIEEEEMANRKFLREESEKAVASEGWVTEKLDEIHEELRRLAKSTAEERYEESPRIYGDLKKSDALEQIQEEIDDSKKNLASLEKDPVKYLKEQIKSYERSIAFSEEELVEERKKLKELDEDTPPNERKDLEMLIGGEEHMIKYMKGKLEDYNQIVKFADAEEGKAPAKSDFEESIFESPEQQEALRLWYESGQYKKPMEIEGGRKFGELKSWLKSISEKPKQAFKHIIDHAKMLDREEGGIHGDDTTEAKRRDFFEKPSEVFVNDNEKNALQLYYQSGRDYPGVNALIKNASSGTKSEAKAEIKALKEWIETIPKDQRPKKLFSIIHKHAVSSYRESIDEEKIGPEARPDPDKPGSYLTPETDKMEAAMSLARQEALTAADERPYPETYGIQEDGYAKEASLIHLKYDQLIEEAKKEASFEIQESTNKEDIQDIEQALKDELESLEEDREDALDKNLENIIEDMYMRHSTVGVETIDDNKEKFLEKYNEVIKDSAKIKPKDVSLNTLRDSVQKLEDKLVDIDEQLVDAPSEDDWIDMLATFYAKSEVLGNIEGSVNVHLAAENANMDIESDEFHSLSRSVTGEEHIDDMNHDQKLKMVARINALKNAGVMTGKDIKNLVLNLLKNVNKETRGEIIYDAEILSGMEMGQLIQIAGEKGVPNVDRFVDDATSLPNLELKNDIVEAILETQDKLYLQMGIGMFPMFKKSTKNRIFRWFSQAWRQSQDRYRLEDREFVWWSRKVLDNLPMNLQNYWVEWSENVPKVTSVDKIKMFVGDGISGKTQDEANIDRAVDFGSEYVNENIKGSEAEEINLSKGKLSGNSGDTSFREGFNRVNATAFNPLGIYIDSEEAQIATVLVNQSASFDDWLHKISDKIPLPDGRTIWEVSRTDKIMRSKLKQFYISILPHNSIRVNRNIKAENSRDNFEFLFQQANKNTPGRFTAKRLKGEGSFSPGKTNPKWARKMHGENYLGDIELVWVNGSDLNTVTRVRDLSGEQEIQASGAWVKKISPRYEFFNRLELWELTEDFFKKNNTVPLFMRGEEDMLATVRISKQHEDFAKLGAEYWNSEDLPQSYRDNYNQEDSYLNAANVARHEAMKQIMGPEYHKIDAPTIMKRLKAFFTPGVSVVDGPPSKVLVFNPDNVVFETTYPEDRGGKVVKVNAMQEIDETPQYILDGMTPTSEKKFRSIYPESLGNDPRSKRAKTIIGGHDDQGVLIGKHQEMTMYVPQGTKMRILDGDKVIAEIYSNGTTTDIYVDGKYVDHLMTENEAKIRLGENFDKMGEVIELPSEATTHIQSVGPPKNTANFPMQLMNYITDPKLQDMVNNMLLTQDHGNSVKNFYEYLFKVADDGAALDEMIINLGDSTKDAPPQYAVEAAKLGAGLHPSNSGMASTLAQSKIIKKAMSVLQKGASLDFRPDHMNMVSDNEIMLPGNVPAIRDQIYEKYAEAHNIGFDKAKDKNISVINKWLRGNDIKVMVVRFPVPSSSGYRIFRVKGLLGSLAGDSFVVSPRVVKEVFEADHDHDTGHISFLDDELIESLEKNQKEPQGIMLQKYVPDDHDSKYNFSNLNDMYQLFEELAFGKQAIGEIVNVTRVAGIVNKHFEHMILDGKKVIPTPLDAIVTDQNSKITDTLENIYRIYGQASFDNAKYRLLKEWGYSQDNLFKLLFSNNDGTPLNDRQYNTLKIYINTLKLNGNIANGYQNQSKYSLSDTFKQSSEYRNFVSGRERYMSHKITSFMAKEYINKLDYADATEIKLKEGQDSIHPHEMLSIMPQLKAEEYGIDVETLFNVPVETSKLAHNDAFVAISENRLDDIISAAGDMTAKEIKSELPVGNAWAQGMIDELDIMFREYETGGDFGLAKVLSQTWDYNDDFVAFAHRWYNGFDTPNGRMSGFKDLSPVAQKYATYAFLHGLNRKSYAANERHNTRNVRMVPPVSRDTITLLDPDIMERYFEEYNGALRGRLSDLTNIKDQDFVSVPRMSRIVEEYFGCG